MAAPGVSSSKSLRQRIIGSTNYNILLGLLAMIILVGSFSALAYAHFNERESDKVVVNGKEFQWDTLNEEYDTMIVQGYEGVSLTRIIEDAGVENPASHEYKFIAGDGYLKTVAWSDIETGILSPEGDEDHDHMVVFESKARAYWVYDLVEIEVV
ncbi:MAG: hypothetical protein ACMUHB_02325 [Thermoplasmatota archaeon]